MIDIWVLTVVIGNECGMTSFQEKHYTEANAVNSSKGHNENLKGLPYLVIAISQSQEQRVK